MENNHQHDPSIGSQFEEKEMDLFALLPFLSSILKPNVESDKLRLLGRLEARLSILEDEVNSLKKLI